MTLKHLVLAGLLFLAIGLYAGRKLSRRVRLIWIIPPILIIGVGAFLILGKREVNQEARAYLGRIEAGNNLSDSEIETFRALSGADAGIRRGVLEICFASTTNASIALPRMGFLLQSCVGLDSTNGSRQEFWRWTVAPALYARPSIELLRLAVASADFLKSGTQEVAEVTGLMLPKIANETNAAMRSLLANELSPLADRMQPAHVSILADVLLRQMSHEQDIAELATLTKNLALAVKRADTGAAQTILSRALDLVDTVDNSAKALSIAEGLAVLSEQMSPDQCRRIAQRLADGWLENDGRPRAAVAALLPPLAGRMRPEDQQDLVLWLVSRFDRYSVSIFYRSWGDALVPILKVCAAGMGNERNVAVISTWIRKPPEVFSDLLWGRLIAPLASELPPDDIQKVAEQVINRIFDGKTQTSGFYAGRFGSLAERMDSDQAQHWVDLLVPRLLGPDAGAEWDPLVKYLSLQSPRLDATAANALAARLLPAMNEKEAGRVLGLSKILTPIASKLDSVNANLMIERLLAAMGSRKNIYRVNAMAEQLAPLARQAKPEQLQPVVEQLVAAMEKETDADNARALTSGLSALSEQMDSKQAARAGDGMVRAIENNPLKYFAQGETLENLSRRIQPTQSQQAVSWLLERGLNRRGPDTFLAQRCVPRMAGALTPDLAEAFVNDLTFRFGKEKDLSAICLRIRIATTFTNELRADKLRFLGERLLQTLDGDTNSYALEPLLLAMGKRSARVVSSPRIFIARQESVFEIFAVRTLCEALAAILPQMRPPDAEELAGRLALRFSRQGHFKPVPFDERAAEALRYAPEKSLREILETPLAVGGLRETALRALELKRA